MTTITRENAEIKSFITGFLSDSAHDNQSSDSLLANVFRIALASLEAEPLVPVMYKGMKLLTKEGLELIRDGIAEATGLEAMCMADALLSATSVPVTPDGWISCSERMPEDGQHVIILCDGAFVLYAQYRDGEFFDIVRNGDEFFETQSRNVTDWMPLPEPPQEVN